MSALLCVLVALGCSRGEYIPPPPSPFDGARALGYVRTFMEFGARVPGTEAHQRAGDWITAEMRTRADTVIEQRWTHRTASGQTLPLRNILARYRLDATERILYVTHWDSRPVADEEEDDAKRKLPVPGANDGGSGVGLFLALGDILKQTPPGYGVDLLFVDGEDYGEFGGQPVDVLLGSKYFADNLPSADYHPLFGVVWDMIGDADLEILQEEASVGKAPEVVSRVWDVAASMGYRDYFKPERTFLIVDDHVPLQAKGMRVIDVIDLTYPPHHTTADTIDKVSARSLKIVGDVAWRLLQR